MRGEAFAIAVIFVAGSAVAQSAPGDETPAADNASVEDVEKQLEGVQDISELSIEDLLGVEVITASKEAESATTAPATIYAITEDTIRARGYQTLEDVLMDVPGVQIQRNSDADARNVVSIRGVAGNDKLIILMDGARISPSTDTPIAIGHNYPVDNVKRVEVVLGPASALYGPDAFSGVVNIITKTGAELAKDKVAGGRVWGSYGNFNTKTGSFALGAQHGDLQLAVDGHYYKSAGANLARTYGSSFDWYRNNYSQSAEMRASPDDPDTTVFVPRTPFAVPSSAYAVHAKANLGNFELGYYRSRESHSSALGGLSDYHVYGADNQYAVDMEAGYARHLWNSAKKTLTVTSTLYYNYYHVDPSSVFVSSATNYQNGYRYGWGRSYKLEEQVAWHPTERLNFILGGQYENLSALAETAFLPTKYQSNHAGQLQNFYYLGTDIVDSSRNSLLIRQDLYNIEYQNYGLYAQGQARPLDSVSITGGVRVDESTRFTATVNPRLGVVLTPFQRTTFKLLYGESFLQPSVYQEYRAAGSFAPQRNAAGDIIGLVGTQWRLPNADLKPQKLRSAEASARVVITDQVALSANGYYLHIDDLIIDRARANQSFKGVQILQALVPTNSGTSAVYGGTGRVDGLFNLGPARLTIWGAYTYTGGNIDHQALTYSAQHLVQGGFELAVWKLHVSPRATYVTQVAHTRYQTDAFEANRSPAYFLLNGFVRLEDLVSFAGFKGSAFLRMDNVLNRHYYNVALQNAADTMVRTPQDPRRFLVGIDIAY